MVSPPIKQPRGLLIRGWHYILEKTNKIHWKRGESRDFGGRHLWKKKIVRFREILLDGAVDVCGCLWILWVRFWKGKPLETGKPRHSKSEDHRCALRRWQGNTTHTRSCMQNAKICENLSFWASLAVAQVLILCQNSTSSWCVKFFEAEKYNWSHKYPTDGKTNTFETSTRSLLRTHPSSLLS